MVKKNEEEFSVWVDNLKLGDYTDPQQISEAPLRQTVELGLRALVSQSIKIEREYRRNKTLDN